MSQQKNKKFFKLGGCDFADFLPFYIEGLFCKQKNLE